jgi:hypothetical protein
MSVKGYTLSVTGSLGSGDLMCSMGIFEHLKFAKIVGFKCSHHIHKNSNYEVMNMLTSLIIVIISQGVHISNYIVHLKYLPFLSIMPQ